MTVHSLARSRSVSIQLRPVVYLVTAVSLSVATVLITTATLEASPVVSAVDAAATGSGYGTQP
mgnify:CR=1 FL=1|jgi:hypothetical protein